MRIDLNDLRIGKSGEDIPAPWVLGNGRLHVDLIDIQKPAWSRFGAVQRQ